MQAVRRINENGHPASEAAAPSDIIHVACHADPSLGKDIVLWDDILAAFKADVVHIRSGTFVLPFLKGPDFKNLDPLRIAAIPGTTLDVVVRNQLGEQELSTWPLQKAQPTTPPEPSPVTISNTAISIRRNPVGGLVEAAMENYTHIENPATAPRLRGPQVIPDDQPSTTGDDGLENSHLVGYQQHQQLQQLSAPQEHSTAFTQKLTVTQKKAELGDKDAQYALGEMYSHGQGTAQNFPKALEWYLKAAIQGHLLAQYTVGRRLQKGVGKPQDFSQAMEWHLKAALQGYAAAQNEVGFMLNHGQGAEKDYLQAMYWYRKAADQGNSAAQCNIGYMYSQGLCVPQDYTLAMEWYRKAADQGSGTALDNVGVLYEHGRGVPEDKVKAMEWYKKAVDKGHPRAKESLERLERLEKHLSKQDEKKRGLFGRLFS